MKNINDYVEKYLYTFNEKPFNEIDSIVLSWLSYYHINADIYKKNSFSEIKIKDLYNRKYFDEMVHDVFDQNSSLKLLTNLASNPRFRNLDIIKYQEKTSKNIGEQFSAMTFRLSKNTYFVAFRGTDHSFVGWKEDFDMAYLKYIPAQADAKRYLTKVMSKLNGNFYVGGHSKGGNLAVYSVLNIDDKLRRRIKKVYSLDGPSLRKETIQDKNYKKILPLIEKYVPQSSVVGMIFEETNNYKIIKSNSIGVLQHCPFYWEVVNDKLKILKDSAFDSKNFKVAINALVNGLSDEELKIFVDTIYGIIESTKSDSVEEMIKDAKKAIPRLFKSIMNLNEDQKKNISKVATIFMKESLQNLLGSIKDFKLLDRHNLPF